MMGQIRYFDIAWQSRADGPGTRVVGFLQGCSLHCPWCHSPHSWGASSPLLYFRDRCLGCRVCEQVCPNEVHVFDGGDHLVDRERCSQCGACVDACPTTRPAVPMSGALALPTETVYVADLYRRIRPQLLLLQGIGGLTISGGEPLLQVGAIRELAEQCHADGVPVAVETSGAMPHSDYKLVASHVDCWLYGLRPCHAPERTQQTVGDIVTVVENLRFLARTSAPIIIRVPLIPGYTTDHISLDRIAKIMMELGLQDIQLLPSNPAANHFYEAAGMPPPLGDQILTLGAQDIHKVEGYMKNRGLSPRVIA